MFSRLTHFGFGRGERLIELVVSLVSVSLRHRRASVVAQTRALASTERKMLSIFFSSTTPVIPVIVKACSAPHSLRGHVALLEKSRLTIDSASG